MASTPRRLQTDVIEAVNFMAGPLARDPSSVTGKESLEIDFGLTGYQRKALAAPFETVGREHKAGVNIKRSECEALKTLESAVALVSTAAGFDGTWLKGGK